MITPKELVTLVRSKIQTEESLLEIASLFDIEYNLDAIFRLQRIEFTQKLYHKMNESDDSDFYLELLSSY